MKRGDIFLVRKANKNDPKKRRAVLVVSRQPLIDGTFSTVICAPIFTRFDNIDTQVEVGVAEGLKHESAVHCDELYSYTKAILTDYVGSCSSAKMQEVDEALRIALSIG